MELQRKRADAPVDVMHNDTFRNDMSVDKKVGILTYFIENTKMLLL